MEVVSKTTALMVVEQKLGFPKPSPRFISWYFKKRSGGYVPIVNFDSLSKEIEKKNLVGLMATVVGVSPNDDQKKRVLCEIYKVVGKHLIQ